MYGILFEGSSKSLVVSFITTRYGTTKITIDSELSDTSENPIKNKAVKRALDELKQNLGGLSGLSFSVTEDGMLRVIF